MIFVTIGTMYGFDRLIRKMDGIAGAIDEKVIMQIGDTSYKPKNAKYFTFASKKDMDKLYNDARVIVCHSGVGSIISSLEYNKPVIVVPRLKAYGEVIDDHQTEIAKELEERGSIKVAYDLEKLGDILKNVNGEEHRSFNKKNELMSNLRNYLDELRVVGEKLWQQ